MSHSLTDVPIHSLFTLLLTRKVPVVAVDMLEEVVSDEEELPKKGKKGQKRKR